MEGSTNCLHVGERRFPHLAFAALLVCGIGPLPAKMDGELSTATCILVSSRLVSSRIEQYSR